MTEVLFRVDASPVMGVGHVMRCRALAESLVERDVEVMFLTASPADIVRALLANMGIKLQTLPDTVAAGSPEDAAYVAAFGCEHGIGAIVLDGYHFTTDYMTRVAQEKPLAVLDDMARLPALPCDLIINSAPHAFALPYRQLAPKAELALGPSFSLIRKDIRDQITRVQDLPSQRSSVLVTFGGSDPLALTEPVVRALLPALPASTQIDVLIGPAVPEARVLMTRLRGLEREERLHLHHAPSPVAPILARAGLAVTAGGGTVGELVALGVPTVTAVVVDNQEGAARAAENATIVDMRQPDGVMRLVQTAKKLWADAPARDAAAREGRAVIDGQGALRVADKVLRISSF